jgi:hypothetical protein
VGQFGLAGKRRGAPRPSVDEDDDALRAPVAGVLSAEVSLLDPPPPLPPSPEKENEKGQEKGKARPMPITSRPKCQIFVKSQD